MNLSTETVSNRRRPFGRLSSHLLLAALATATACSGGSNDSPTRITDDGVKAQGQIVISPSTISVTEEDSVAVQASHTRNANFKSGSVTWSVDPADVGTVRDGYFVSTAPGTAEVTARYAGQSATADADVRPLPRVVESLSSASFLGVAGEWAGDSVQVRVSGTKDLPVEGVRVRFAVVEGGGDVSASSRLTDASGEASVAWRLGPSTGRNVLEARIDGLEPARFAAEAMADAADARVVLVSGDGQAGEVGEVLPEPLVAELVDPNGNPVPGTTLEWGFSAGAGGPSVGSLLSVEATASATTLETVTDSLGRSVVYWKMGPRPGDHSASATARVTGGASPAPGGNPRTRFNAKATPGHVDSLDVSPDTTSLQVGGATTLVATGYDAYGNLLEGLDVKWSSGKPGVASVNENGRVRGESPGAAGIEAKVGPVATVARVLVESLTPAQASATAGDGQTGVVAETLPTELAVRVTTADGQAVPDVSVDWSAAEGGAMSPATSTTDADGIARTSWTLGDTAGTQEATAQVAGLEPVAFQATAEAGAPAEVEVSPSSLSLSVDGTRNLEAIVRDAAGNVLTSASLQWSVDDPNVASVDAAGAVTGLAEGSTTVTADAEGATGSATVNVTGYDPTTLETAGGSGQTGTVGSALAEDLSVRVLDETGAPFPGASVAWTVTDGNGSLSAEFSETDAEGIARTSWTLGTTPGSQAVRASVSGLSPVSFEATAETGPVHHVTVTPSSTSLQVGETEAFSADAFDAFDNHISGTSVSWSVEDAAVATVATDGTVTAAAAGSTVVRAEADGVSGSSNVSVTETTSAEKPGEVSDLQVVSTTETSVTLSWSQVDDGTGSPAKYAVRYGSPTISWGGAYPTEQSVEGDATSGTLTWTRTGLEAGTDYEFRLVSYRGTLNVDAVFGPLSNTAATVTDAAPVEVESVVADRSAHTFTDTGTSLQLDATARDASGAEVTDAELSWTSTDPSVATVSSTGLVTSQAAGSALIVVSAVCCTAADTVDVAVELATTATVAEVVADREEHTFSSLGETVQLSATALDEGGAEVQDATLVWSSTDPEVASVDATGLVTVQMVGDASIVVSAECCAPADTVRLVADETTAHVEVTPSTFSLTEGETQGFTAAVLDENGNEASVKEFTWSSSDPTVATVDASGMVEAVGTGTVEIHAAVAGLDGMSSGDVTSSGSGGGGDDGSTPTGDFLFHDGFESGDWSNDEGGWSWNANPINVDVSTANPRSGSYSLEFTYPGEGDGDDSTAEQRWSMPAVDEIWIEYWFYLPDNFYHRSQSSGGVNNKFLRIWGGGYRYNNPKGGASFNPIGGGDSNLYLQWGDHDNVMFAGQADLWEPAFSDGSNGTHARGTWAQYRFHIKLASGEDTNDARFRMWVDGDLKVDRDNADWYGTGPEGNVFTEGYLMGWSNSGYSETTRFYIDDLSVFTTDPGW